MSDISSSVPTELPSTRTLIRSTLVATIIAGVLLATVVLPAEYGIDPTGMGTVLGLTQMGKIKTSLASEAELAKGEAENAVEAPAPPATEAAPAAAASAAEAAPESAAEARKDTMSITLEPNQGREVKLSMHEGARVAFAWSSEGGVVNYDQHADSKEPPRPYHGYRKGSGVASDEGNLVAAFEGWHGWFWRNRGAQPVTVTLHVTGQYQAIKEVK